jgi:hypothetical protein
MPPGQGISAASTGRGAPTATAAGGFDGQIRTMAAAPNELNTSKSPQNARSFVARVAPLSTSGIRTTEKASTQTAVSVKGSRTPARTTSEMTSLLTVSLPRCLNLGNLHESSRFAK